MKQTTEKFDFALNCSPGDTNPRSSEFMYPGLTDFKPLTSVGVGPTVKVLLEMSAFHNKPPDPSPPAH